MRSHVDVLTTNFSLETRNASHIAVEEEKIEGEKEMFIAEEGNEVTLSECRKIQVRPNKKLTWKEIALSSPRKRKLYEQLEEKRTKLHSAQKKLKRYSFSNLTSTHIIIKKYVLSTSPLDRYHRKLKNPDEHLKTDKCQALLNKLLRVQQSFIEMILKNGLRDPSGRRYSKGEQILSLSIFKKSNRAYRYLRTFLPLPNVTT